MPQSDTLREKSVLENGMLFNQGLSVTSVSVLCVSRSLWLRWCVLPLAMPPAMTDLLDIWAAHSPLAGHALDQITVDFLLPTGIYIQMDVPREATIQHIKLVSGTENV